MANISTPVSSTSTSQAFPDGSYVEWGAIIAGGVLAGAISFVLLAFGSSIGLSATSPWPQSSGLSASTAASLAVFWTIAQQIGAVMAGGYVAGRMRRRWADTPQDEVEFRDGLHGALVWAVAVIVGACLVLSTAGSVLKGAGDVAGKAVGEAATSDPVAYQVSTLLRPATSTNAPGTPPASANQQSGSTAEVQSELMGIFGRSIANGTLADTDRSYLTGLVAQRAGIPRDEAEKRIQTAYAEAVRATREAADKARKAGIVTGLVTAMSLMISLAAGWWSALQGGHHRDNAIPARFVRRVP
jgi:hypothetical protein